MSFLSFAAVPKVVHCFLALLRKQNGQIPISKSTLAESNCLASWLQDSQFLVWKLEVYRLSIVPWRLPFGDGLSNHVLGMVYDGLGFRIFRDV